MHGFLRSSVGLLWVMLLIMGSAHAQPVIDVYLSSG